MDTLTDDDQVYYIDVNEEFNNENETLRPGRTGYAEIQSREESRSMVLDKTWFSDRVHEHQDELYRLAYYILKNKEDAEDALQETLFRAYSNLWQLKSPKFYRACRCSF